MSDIDLDRHAVVEASAGTGKTWTLEQLVLQLLREGRARLDQILLVTYTEKATGELKTRLRQALDKELSAGSEHRAAMQAALDVFDQASISTIHGFCQRTLQEYAFENREDFRARLVQDGDLMESGLREIQRRAWRQEYGDRLPLILELAGYAKPGGAADWERKVLTLAGSYRPGCGHRLAPAPRADLLDALQQLETELRTSLPELRRWARQPLRRERIETHPWNVGFGQLQFRGSEARRTGLLLPLLRWLADTAAQTQPIAAFHRLLYECADAGNFDRDGFTLLTDKLGNSKSRTELPARCPGLAEAVAELERLRHLSNGLALGEQLVVRTVLQLQDHLAAVKRERGLQSFEDLLTRVDRALDPAHNHRAADFAAALRQRYQYAIVDEFQDTDPIQWRIFRRLFVEGDGHRLFVVGDPKQAIFGFRGADLRTFVDARDELIGQQNADQRDLTVNWRSCPEILEALNQLFDRSGWFEGTGITYSCVQPPEGQRPNVIEDDRTDRAALTLVDLSGCGTLTQARVFNARHIAREIQRLLSGDAPLEFSIKGRRRLLSADDICILIYKRSEAPYLIEALQAAGIPFTFYKQPGLWQSSEAVHLDYVLRALARPEEPQAFRKLLLTRFCRVRPEELAACDELPAQNAVRELFQRWRGLAEERHWSALFQSLLEDTGVLFCDLDAPDAERRLANTRHILQTLEQAAYAQDLDLLSLLEVFDQLRRRPGSEDAALQPIETDRPRVRILTVHASKGLEYPVVFLAGGFTQGRSSSWQTYRSPVDHCVVFDLLPDDAAREAAQQERAAEDRRLLYVALTRAMFKLYVPKLGVGRPSAWAGPAATLLAPAIERSGVEGLGHPCVETIVPRDAGRLPEPRPLQFAEATPAAPKLITPGELFPQLDGELAQRKVVVRSFSSLHRERLRTAPQGPVYADWSPRADDDAPDALDDSPLLRGPVFGSMVHAVLEQIDYTSVAQAKDGASLLEAASPGRMLIDAQFGEHLAELPARGDEALLARCRQLMADLVWKGLHTPLQALGGPLALVPAQDRLHELEFTFPEWDGPEPAGMRLQEGFLTGVIDLVVRRDHRFFLVDWKTNILPGGYAPADLKLSMEDCEYDVQYRLYLQALARWLKRRRGRAFNPARDFGGVYYLYLRGLNGRDESTGVFFAAPTSADLRLDSVLQ